jgi:hypothetical protein
MSELTKTSKYQIPKIEWDDERDEPFCRIIIKGEEYRMTMWRESDGDDMVSLSDVLPKVEKDLAELVGPELESSSNRKMEFQTSISIYPRPSTRNIRYVPHPRPSRTPIFSNVPRPFHLGARETKTIPPPSTSYGPRSDDW